MQIYPSLQKLDLADYSNSTSHDSIDVLVGSDYYWSIVKGEVVKVEVELMAVNSKIGWLISGPTNECPSEDASHTQLAISIPHVAPYDMTEDDQLQSTLKMFWETDSFGTCHESVTFLVTIFCKD